MKKFYIIIIIAISIFNCKKDEVSDLPEDNEVVISERIIFSKKNNIPNNLKILSLEGVTNVNVNQPIDISTNGNGIEFLLNQEDEIIFIRMNYPNYIDDNISAKSTILYLTTFNSIFAKLTDEEKTIIINQILNHNKFSIILDYLNDLSNISITTNSFKVKIREFISIIFSEDNLNNTLGRTTNEAPLVDVSYSDNNNVVSVTNNTHNHIGYGIRINGAVVNSGLMEGEETVSIPLYSSNENYHFKFMSGADISGVFNNNQFEEIEAFNADFNEWLIEAYSILLQMAIPQIEDSCIETIFNTAIDGVNFAQDYGNNNNANTAFNSAFIDFKNMLPGLVEGGFSCIEIDQGILGQILSVFNVVTDIIDITNFLIDTTQTITEYYAYENIFQECYYYNGTGILLCEDVVSPVFNPIPNNNSSNIPLSGNISFLPGANTPNNATYRLYFGTTNNPTNYQNLSETSSTYSGALENTTYYWKVKTISSSGVVLATSPIWNFTTLTSSNNTTPTVTTNSTFLNITETSVTSGGNVTSDGGSSVSARGVCWSTSSNPNINNSDFTTNGNGEGSFTSSITSLSPNTQYYVKAYATNSEGTTYGTQRTFTTSSSSSNTIPTVTTNTVSNTTQTSATSGGNVTSDGGSSVSARGVCWSTSSNPNINNSDFTTNGNGEGSFTSSITGLSPNTQYYVKAYATNSEGTAYGTQRTFTTENTSGSPNLIISEFDIDDDTSGGSDGNNSGTLDAGEDIELHIRLQNIGNSTAHNVTAYLSTSDNLINITDDDEGFSDILANGGEEWSDNDFDFVIDANYPTQQIHFTLHIVSDEGSWDKDLYINVQGQSENNPISITPTNTCNSAPVMDVNTVYEVSNFDFSQFGSAYPIDGESYQGGLVKGFYLSIQVPTTQSYKIRIFDVSSNFDSVFGVKYECNTGYYQDMNSGNIYRNDTGYGGNETFYAGNFSSSYTYNLRIYHYYGNDTPVISFKVEVIPN